MFKKLIVISLSIILITGCVHTKNQTSKKTQEDKESVPDLTLENYEGEQVKIKDINKPTVINAWAGWCTFCKEELKDFAKSQEKFKDKVEIIAINRGESKQKAKGFTDELGVTNSLTLLLDPNDRFYREIGGIAMPETIFVNSNGKIVFHKRGPMNFEEINDNIKRHLLNKE